MQLVEKRKETGLILKINDKNTILTDKLCQFRELRIFMPKNI